MIYLQKSFKHIRKWDKPGKRSVRILSQHCAIAKLPQYSECKSNQRYHRLAPAAHENSIDASNQEDFNQLPMSAKAIPDGYDSLIPSKVVRDAAKAIEFYKAVFGATELMRMNYPDSPKIAHAEIKIRNHVLMLGDENPQMGAFAPQADGKTPSSSVMIYVEDVDATIEKALEHGGKSTMPIMDMFWGDRYGKFVDPFGHLWGVATHKRDVSPEDCAKAMAEWGKQKPGCDQPASHAS